MKIEGLQKLTKLRELYMSHNGIEKLEGLDHNVGHTSLKALSGFVIDHFKPRLDQSRDS